MGVSVVIGGDNLPFPVGIGLTDPPNIGGASGSPGPPGSGITDFYVAESDEVNLPNLWYLHTRPSTQSTSFSTSNKAC